MADDIFVRDSNNQLAVNTVVSTEANVPYNYDDCFTLDTNNRRALRVVSAGGGSGGDQHNLGWYATSSDLETAHPTAEAGDWAIVGATDTVWIWDTDNSAWVDSDQKGQVISVNSKTGTVVLTASDVGAVPQYSTMPTATAEIVGNIVQFTGTTDANYTNGYFYKCVSDGQTPATYSWEAVEVQASSGGLPTQTGNAGKFLTTDGTDASWSDKPLVNKSTSNSSYVVSAITSGTILTSSNTTIFGYTTGSNVNCSGSVVGFGTELGLGAVDNVAVGHQAYLQPNAKYSVVVGKNTSTGGTWNLQHKYLVAVGCDAKIGEYGTTTTAIIGAMQFGKGTNLESGTVCFGLTTDGTNFNNYKLLDPDGTIPAARHASLPSADGTYVLKLVISGGVPTLSWVAE